MTVEQILVSVAQLAAGGGIFQAIVAFTRRGTELRKLDRDADSVAVETADHLVRILRQELDLVKQDLADERAAHAREKAARDEQVSRLSQRLADLQTELSIARAEIARLGGKT